MISVVKSIKRRKSVRSTQMHYETKPPEDPKLKEQNAKALDILKNRFS